MANAISPPTDDPIAVADAEATPGQGEIQSSKGGKIFRGFAGTRWIEFFNSVTSAITDGLKVGSAALSDQSASIGATNIAPAGNSAGVYRVSYEMEITTAAGVSSSVTLGLSWTGNGVTKSFIGAAMNGNTTATYQTDTLIIYIDGGTTVNYAITYASNPASAAKYMLNIILEAVDV